MPWAAKSCHGYAIHKGIEKHRPNEITHSYKVSKNKSFKEKLSDKKTIIFIRPTN